MRINFEYSDYHLAFVLLLIVGRAYYTKNYRMLLAIDIGNSNIVLGLHADEKWTNIFRIITNPEEKAAHYEAEINALFTKHMLGFSAIDTVVLSSVVPILNVEFKSLLQKMFGFEPIVLGPSTYSLLELGIERPNEIGTDLVANAAAAHHIYQKDCIIVDFGTALTFTIVNANGKILGVNIAPGLVTAVKALFGNTAQLPEVPLELPPSIIGVNTNQAIQNGILWGYVGLVRFMLQKIRAELGDQYIAVATGGLSSILHPLRDDFFAVERHLTLDGLRIIGEHVK